VTEPRLREQDLVAGIAGGPDERGRRGLREDLLHQEALQELVGHQERNLDLAQLPARGARAEEQRESERAGAGLGSDRQRRPPNGESMRGG
jgi:hypothetical protein